MRADIATPLQPSLPSGTADTPPMMGDSPPLMAAAVPPPSSPQRSAARRLRKLQLQQHQQQMLLLQQQQQHLLLQQAAAAAQDSNTSSIIRSNSFQRVRRSKRSVPATSSGEPTMYVPEHLAQASAAAVTDPQTNQEKRELLEYFQKLQVLVPSLPKTGKIPKLDIIEHVITYIKKLESDLIDHPMIQVLENNAYISGLLQSMAPEFDISHLFPTRSSSSHGNSISSSPNSSGSSSPSSSPDQSGLYLRGDVDPSSLFATPSPRSPRNKSKSSHRKPFGLLSVAQHNK